MIRTLLLGLCAASLAACASTTHGSWACRAVEGRACASIRQIDQEPPADGAMAGEPAIGRTITARLAAGPMTAQTPQGAPYREADPVVRVAVAPWVDRVGDYHAATEVFAVMRRGTWWQTPQTRTLQLAPPAKPVTAEVEAPAP